MEALETQALAYNRMVREMGSRSAYVLSFSCQFAWCYTSQWLERTYIVAWRSRALAHVRIMESIQQTVLSQMGHGAEEPALSWGRVHWGCICITMANCEHGFTPLTVNTSQCNFRLCRGCCSSEVLTVSPSNVIRQVAYFECTGWGRWHSDPGLEDKERDLRFCFISSNSNFISIDLCWQ